MSTRHCAKNQKVHIGFFAVLLFKPKGSSSSATCGCCLLKNWGVKLMEDEGDSGWIEQTDDGHPLKKEGRLSDSFRSESSSPGRAISYSWRATFRGCIMQGRKTAKGSKNRIPKNLNIDHRITSSSMGPQNNLSAAIAARDFEAAFSDRRWRRMRSAQHNQLWRRKQR